jgi:hypothetical protein
LRVSPEPNRMRIMLASDGWVEYKLFRLDNPDRLVLDLPGVAHDVPGPGRTQRFEHPLVQEVRIAQNRIEPPLVRLVMVVRNSPEVQVLPRPDALIVEISGGGQ